MRSKPRNPLKVLDVETTAAIAELASALQTEPVFLAESLGYELSQQVARPTIAFDFTGPLFSQDGVHLTAGDPVSFVRSAADWLPSATPWNN